MYAQNHNTSKPNNIAIFGNKSKDLNMIVKISQCYLQPNGREPYLENTLELFSPNFRYKWVVEMVLAFPTLHIK